MNCDWRAVLRERRETCADSCVSRRESVERIIASRRVRESGSQRAARWEGVPIAGVDEVS